MRKRPAADVAADVTDATRDLSLRSIRYRHPLIRCQYQLIRCPYPLIPCQYPLNPLPDCGYNRVVPAHDLRARLQRLRPRKAPPPRELTYEPLPGTALPGREHATPHGAFQLIEERYPLSQRHGHLSFEALLTHEAATLAKLARAPQLASADVRRLAFLDTETTGLAGGAGTLAFLIGVGVFEAEHFVIRQYFLRRPDEEPAALTQLTHDLKTHLGWVTFNGRAFDLPVLETRFTLNRQRNDFRRRPHLDLLFPARLLYRGRLDSCALSSLEQHVLGVPRSHDDVPGALIPEMYVRYLQTGETGDMRRVIYHNAIDILSMVTLAAHLLEVFSTETEDDGRKTAAASVHRPRSSVEAADLLRLAYWHDHEGRAAEAEAAYRRALAGKLALEDRAAALLRFAALLKRHNRRAEAVPLWEQLASFSTEDSLACVELAKFYEWKAADLPRALTWARRAEAIIKAMPPGWRKKEAQAAIARRVERLQEKLNSRERKP
jgi:hypothetical protein